MQEIEGLLKFARFLDNFQKIERKLWLNGRDHPENDVEHSFQLAMLSWYAIGTYKLPLDADKVLKYALVHDLVEVYAGDTDAFDRDPDQHTSKKGREHTALEQIKKEFEEFPELSGLIEQYEERSDEESKFVYALDKVLGPINIYFDGGRSWHKKGVTLEEMVAYKVDKVSLHPEVKKYFEQMLEILKKDEHTLFPQKHD